MRSAPRAARRLLGRLGRGLYKFVVLAPRYRTAEGYDARRYWTDRFLRHGDSLRGPGDEGLSEEENRRAYAVAGGVLLEALRSAGADLARSRVLEVGCGSGFYTALLAEAGVRSYTGLDVTDAFFERLRPRFPDFSFTRGDITSSAPVGPYDLVLMIDVAQHIVSPDGFDRALGNLRASVRPGGLLALGPLPSRARRRLFYVRFWSAGSVRARLSECDEVASAPFRTGRLLVLRAPKR